MDFEKVYVMILSLILIIFLAFMFYLVKTAEPVRDSKPEIQSTLEKGKQKMQDRELQNDMLALMEHIQKMVKHVVEESKKLKDCVSDLHNQAEEFNHWINSTIISINPSI